MTPLPEQSDSREWDDMAVLIDSATRWASVIILSLRNGGYGNGKRRAAAEAQVRAIEGACLRLSETVS
jgi:hypothetical protein